tara:strand:- start:3142 stop:4236 length:1095 start_codon:yes stop_codon:yes gene_type:complete
MLKKITIVAGARPNFMKVAPIINEIKNKIQSGFDIDFDLVHTGQHYDKNMSDNFFKQLNIPNPSINLECSGNSHAKQTADIMCKFEDYLIKNPTNLVLVVGDVNSTLACSIVAQKLKIKVAHVEAGIRSHDWSMPEEINRLVTDSISNYFFTTSREANNNLLKSGIEKNKIFFVGNTMIDTLLNNSNKFYKPLIWNKLNLSKKSYAVLTLHRPDNVDNIFKLEQIIKSIHENLNGLPIVFPLHPRTRNYLNKINLDLKSIYYIKPLSYLEFNYLVKNSKVIITDSGGITEEATIFKVPCMTVRDNTERPETVNLGTNKLIGTNPKKFAKFFKLLFSNKWGSSSIPELWDGKSSKRIVSKILEIL